MKISIKNSLIAFICGLFISINIAIVADDDVKIKEVAFEIVKKNNKTNISVEYLKKHIATKVGQRFDLNVLNFVHITFALKL